MSDTTTTDKKDPYDIFWFIFRLVFNKITACVTIMAIILGGGYFLLSIHHVDNYELGFTFDRFGGGKIESLSEEKGWIYRNRFRYAVHTIDLRPQQVSISANNRILNARLVRFNPAGLATFVEWHGRDAGDDTPKMYDILKSYAFGIDGGKSCPFLTIVEDMTPKLTLPE